MGFLSLTPPAGSGRAAGSSCKGGSRNRSRCSTKVWPLIAAREPVSYCRLISASWATRTRRQASSRRRMRRWTKGWRSRPGTTSAHRKPSCTAFKASCTWPRRTTGLPPRSVSTRRSRRPVGCRARAWELRATTSLARLWQRQGRRNEARDALAAVYGTYTEGFTTPDLVDAKVLLESLAEPI